MWPVMAGCCLHDYEGARRKWTEFWTTYKKIYPGFGLFDDDTVDLSRCAAFFLHGDEGRTLKKGGMLVTSLQSALGRGYDQKRVRRPGEGGRDDLQVNFAGHSFTTRFILSAIPKTAYDLQPNLFHDAIGHVAKACRRLLDYGYVDTTRGGETFRICILSVKGDAPYLTKVANFYRTYNTSAKRGQERGPPKGTCPYCLAGTNLCAAEEIGTATPKWLATVAVKLPWVREPSLITHLVHDRSDPASFFKSDIWHVFHLGFGRSWIASLVQLILPQLPLPNLDEKWDYLTDHYHGWCSQSQKQSHISKITPYLMSYHDTSGCMGNWHKGALTTNFMLWMVSLLGDVPVDTDGLLAKARVTTYRVNEMFSVLYRSGAFLSENEGRFVAEQGLKFLEIGLLPALMLYALSCFLNRYTLLLVFRSCQLSKVKVSYPDVARFCFGSTGFSVVALIMTSQCCITSTAYVVTVGEVLFDVVPLSRRGATMLGMLLLMPFTLIRSLKRIAILSTLATIVPEHREGVDGLGSSMESWKVMWVNRLANGRSLLF
eukprot:s1191_g5.t1